MTPPVERSRVPSGLRCLDDIPCEPRVIEHLAAFPSGVLLFWAQKLLGFENQKDTDQLGYDP